MIALSPATREELIIKIHDELRRIHELLDHLDMVLPQHEEKLNGSSTMKFSTQAKAEPRDREVVRARLAEMVDPHDYPLIWEIIDELEKGAWRGGYNQGYDHGYSHGHHAGQEILHAIHE